MNTQSAIEVLMNVLQKELLYEDYRTALEVVREIEQLLIHHTSHEHE